MKPYTTNIKVFPIVVMVCLLSLLCSQVCTAACLFGWQETRNAKSGERETSFFLSPKDLTSLMEADERGDVKIAEKLAKELPTDLWAYGLLLKGEASIFRVGKIGLMKFNGHEIVEISSGSVEVDSKRGTVLRELRRGRVS